LIAAVLLLLFRGLMHARDPFAAAPRLCARMPASHETHGDAWRRFDVERGFVELGPFERKTPRKIIIVARFATHDEASSFMHQIADAVPVAAQPRFPPDTETWRGVIIEGRMMFGLEIANSDCFVVITLVADGPRTIVPYTSSQ
jgi:hypothetical protein